MVNDIYLKFIKHDFDDASDAKAVEYASVFGLALDYVSEGGLFKTPIDLEAIYMCYIPFYAAKLNEDNYISINAMQPEKNNLEISKIPERKEIQSILHKEDDTTMGKVERIESELRSSQSSIVEVSGILNKEGKNGMVKLITQHKGNEKTAYKKVTPLISKEEIKRQINILQKYAISEQQLETEVENLLDDIEKEFQELISKEINKKDELEKEYANKIKEQKEAIKQKLKEIESEEKREKERIDNETEQKKKTILSKLKSDKIWGQIKSDIKQLEEHLARIKQKIDTSSDETDIDGILNEIRILQDETQTFGTGLESTRRELSNRKHEYSDIDQQAIVDKRVITDQLNATKEDEKKKLKDVEIEREYHLETQEGKIKNAKQDLERFKEKRKALKQELVDNYQLVSNYTMKADVLGADATGEFVTIYVPVAICKYKEKKKLLYKVLIPFEIPPRMSKPKKLELIGENGRIGFDCIAFEAKNFLKKKLELLIEESTDIQAEIQGTENKLATGKIDLINSGFNVLEETKGYDNNNSTWIIGKYRTIK